MSATLTPPVAGPLRGRDFRLLLIATVGSFANYSVLLPLVPEWAARGGAGPAGAGATNGVFLLVTVVAQVAAPALGRRFGYRSVAALGAATLGLPSVGYALTAALPALVAFSALRGVGFGLLTVAAVALVAELSPPAARGRATGLHGLAIGVPNVLLLPVGGTIADTVGYPVVFLVTAALPVAAIGAVLAIRRPCRAAAGPRTGRVAPRSLAAPWTAMLAAAVASAAIVTFAPLSVTAVPLVLAGFGIANVAGRYGAGVAGDRGLPSLLVPAGAVAAAGIAALALAARLGPDGAVPAVAAGVLFGAGFGAVQNQALVVLFHRSGPGGHGAASAAYNIAYDAGSGFGSIALGLLAGAAGYPWAFAVTAAVLAASLPAMWHAGHPSRSRDTGAGDHDAPAALAPDPH